MLLPKVNGTVTLASLSTSRPSGTLPGETEVENRYLRVFQEETTSGFQSAWDWAVWNRLMLQGCHHEGFIRDAVVAIGAIRKSMSTLYLPDGTTTTNAQELARLQREFAYHRYGKALKNIQKVIHAGASRRLALIACLLIVCFENLVGHRYNSSCHAQYGLKIYSQAQEAASSQSLIEEEIIEALRNLDIQITTINDARMTSIHTHMLEKDRPMVESMPRVFSSLDEAKRYWQVTMCRCVHYLAISWARTEPESLCREFKTHLTGGVTVTTGGNIFTTPFKVDDALRADQRIYFAEMCRWLEAFEPVLTKIRRDPSGTLRAYVAASTLQIQGLTAKIILAGSVFTKEMSYDQFYPEFKSIIRLASDVLKVRNASSKVHFFAGMFSFDIGLVPCLFTLLLRCRDTTLRLQALEILKVWHMEGWWDPLLIVGVGKFIMEVEEAGTVNGVVPEEARAILTAKYNRPPDRNMLLQCVQRTKSGLKWTEKFVAW